MNNEKTSQPVEKKTAMKVLEETSRTFYIPISYLPDRIREAVASAYLCLRAIDEVEDHPTLENALKSKILKQISYTLQTSCIGATLEDLTPDWCGAEDKLPEVTLRIAEWCLFAPSDIAPRIWDATASMADRMAFWADRNFEVKTKKDLDAYTFSVAGAVGLILSELWEWYEGVKTNRELAIAFGRGLQATNILRNKGEDKERGVTFYPEGWTEREMQEYARQNLKKGEEYKASLPEGSAAITFCKIPLSLAVATLDFLSEGKEKLTRTDVLSIVKKCLGVGGH
jgi:farnesyl-diphosphate farnesyltransferase